MLWCPLSVTVTLSYLLVMYNYGKANVALRQHVKGILFFLFHSRKLSH